ncbi:uncharacterized protein LOC133803419 [Humulus lupulus]|uniref:uncharacterized protein LOC133803419 n=1 Tax=Humulus lupulus TaxID=3486 RepID=UPI002B413C1A|nr:uncharacterized protein LOC133803419 [Humulus lupulus]
MTSRGTSYTFEEDVHLCQTYLHTFKDPNIGKSHSKENLWRRVEVDYNSSKPEFITQIRPKRSLQCRMQVILTAVGRLRGCIQQAENLNPKDASEQNILNQAKVLLAKDKNYKKGFKFDHVWPLLKDSEKCANNINTAISNIQRENDTFAPSQSKSPTSESSTSASLELSSFSLKIFDENVGHCSTQQPNGTDKANSKRKNNVQNSDTIDIMEQENRQLADMLKENNSYRQKIYQIQMLRAQIESRKLSLAEYREENKILLADLNSITDPKIREFFLSEQTRIMQKRSQQQGQGSRQQGQDSKHTSD